MPAAGNQAAVNGVQCLFFVDMKRLGVEAPAEVDDIAFFNTDRAKLINRVYRIVFKITLVSGDLKI